MSLLNVCFSCAGSVEQQVTSLKCLSQGNSRRNYALDLGPKLMDGKRCRENA